MVNGFVSTIFFLFCGRRWGFSFSSFAWKRAQALKGAIDTQRHRLCIQYGFYLIPSLTQTKTNSMPHLLIHLSSNSSILLLSVSFMAQFHSILESPVWPNFPLKFKHTQHGLEVERWNLFYYSWRWSENIPHDRWKLFPSGAIVKNVSSLWDRKIP